MNIFEKACSEVDGMMHGENVIEFMRDSKTATVTFSQGRYISKIKKLAEKYPEEVKVVAESKDCLVAHIPTSYIKINNPPKRILSEEQKLVVTERLRGLRKK